jgi:hypothetical protein
MSAYTQNQYEYIADNLDTRPHKTIQLKKAAEVVNELLVGPLEPADLSRIAGLQSYREFSAI